MTEYKRYLGNVQYVENQMKTFDIPCDAFLKKLSLRLSGTVSTPVFDSANPNKPILKHDNPLGLINRIDVRVNGKDTIKSVSFANKYWIDTYHNATQPELIQTPNTNNKTKSFSAKTTIDFDLNKIIKTYLPTRNLTSLKLLVTWANSSKIATNTTINEAQLDITSTENSSTDPRLASGIFIENEIIQNITAAGKQKISLPQGNFYKGFFLKAINDGNPSNDFIESFDVELGGMLTIRSENFMQARSDDKTEYSLDVLPNGCVMIDFPQPINTSKGAGVTNFDLIVHTKSPTGIANIQVVTQELILPISPTKKKK